MRGKSEYEAYAGGADDDRPLIAHVFYRLGIGGLENGVVNLINNMPDFRYRHVIICLSELAEFRERITRGDIQCYALNKRAGQDVAALYRLWRLLRVLKPAVVHTRNLAGLECLLPAAMAGVRCRVHGEHGRDMSDLDGTRRRYVILRKLFRPFVTRYVAVSKETKTWLQEVIRITPASRIAQLYNGVDKNRFKPGRPDLSDVPVSWATDDNFIVGTVGRMSGEKDQITLVKAFIRLVQERRRDHARQPRLVLVGEGPLREEAADMLDRHDMSDLAWLPGSRSDIENILRLFDVFVLPSLTEGLSNTILEAMATGLPVVATRVGGNRELVLESRTGRLVEPSDPEGMARAIARYLDAPAVAHEHGRAGRERIEEEFSIQKMVEGYTNLYDDLLGRTGPAEGVKHLGGKSGGAG